MNRPSFLQMDLKSFGVGTPKSGAQPKPFQGIKTILILLALASVVYGAIKGLEKKKILQADISAKQVKLDILKKYQATETDYQAMMGGLPKSVDRELLFKKISDMAMGNKVEILSFVPSDRKLNDMIEANILSLSLMTENYDNLISFISQMESSGFMVRIERWNAQMRLAPNKDGDMKEAIYAQIDVAGLDMIDKKQELNSDKK